MTLSKMLLWEGTAFLYLLAATVAYRLVTRQIRIGGLLARPGNKSGASPERVQLLVATLALCVRYAMQVAHNTTGNLPDVDKQWLYLFGGSSGIYATVKAAFFMKGNKS